MKNIVVIFGGTSCEKDVSVITGVMTSNNIDKSLYKVIPIYIGEDGFWYTSSDFFDISYFKNLDKSKITRITFLAGDNRIYYLNKNKLKCGEHISAAINCTHGIGGEDGSVSAVMDLSHIALASPDIASSAVSMDKQLTKLFLKGIGVDCLPYVTVTGEDVPDIPFSYPVIVKPTRQGSSIGIKKAENSDRLFDAICYAKRYDEKVIVEKCLQSFREINCAAYRSEGGIVTSLCEEPLSNGFLSFDDKYNGGKHIFPAKISKDLTDRIRAITEKVYSELGFDGVIRIDYLVSEDNVYLNEINGVPGSLAYYLFCTTFSDFSHILTGIIKLAEQKFAKKSTQKSSYKSSVLMIECQKGGKRL